MEDNVDYLIKLTRIDQRISADQAGHVRRQMRKLSFAFKEELQDFPENDDYFDYSSDSTSSIDISGFSFTSSQYDDGDDHNSLDHDTGNSELTKGSSTNIDAEAIKTVGLKQKKLCPLIRQQNKDTRWDYETASYKRFDGSVGKKLSHRNKRRSSLTKLSHKETSAACQTSKKSQGLNKSGDDRNIAKGDKVIGKIQKARGKDSLEAAKTEQKLKPVNPELEAVVIKHLQSCSNWIKRRRLCNFRDVKYARKRVDGTKWNRWMAHMQSKLEDENLFAAESGGEEDDENRLKKERPIDRWRRKARVVRRLCGVCLTLRRYAVEAGLMNNFVVSVSSRRVCVSAGDGGEVTEELEWDLDNYRAKQEIPIPKGTIEMLEKLPQYRSTHDIQVIAMLMRSLPSFRKYTSEMQKMMCRIVRYMRCTSRRVVLRKGHVGYSVYFIVRGSVSVVMGKDDQSVFVKPEVVILRKGACFGEIALLQNTRRNATIVCAEDCEFLVIDKEDFIQNGLNQRLDQEFAFRYNTYRSWPAIQSWVDETVKRLAYCSRTEDFSHNKVIVQSSQVNEFLWFVVKGSCDVLRLVDLQNRPELSTLQTLPSGLQRFVVKSPRQPPASETKKKRAQSAPLRPKSVLQKRVKSARMAHKQEQVAESDTSTQSTYSSLSALSEKGSLLSGSSESSHSSSEVTLRSHTEVRQPGSEQSVRKIDSKTLPSPIYIQVDQLRDGQCFGLESLFSDIDTATQQYSLVSKGCVLIHVPRRKFLELTDEKSLERIRASLKEYPDDHDLVEGFLNKRIWDNFKQSLVEEVIIDKIQHHAGGSGGDTPALRSHKVEEYMKRKGEEYGSEAATYGTMLNEEASSKAKHRLKSAMESRSARTPAKAHHSVSINNNNNLLPSRLMAAEGFNSTRLSRGHPSNRLHDNRTPTLTQRLNGLFRSSTPRGANAAATKGSSSDAYTLDSSVALGTKLRHLKSQSTVISSPRKLGGEGGLSERNSRAVGTLKSRSIVVTSREKREVAMDTSGSPRQWKGVTSGRLRTDGDGFVCSNNKAATTPRTKVTSSSKQGGLSRLDISAENLLKSRSSVLLGQ